MYIFLPLGGISDATNVDALIVPDALTVKTLDSLLLIVSLGADIRKVPPPAGLVFFLIVSLIRNVASLLIVLSFSS